MLWSWFLLSFPWVPRSNSGHQVCSASALPTEASCWSYSHGFPRGIIEKGISISKEAGSRELRPIIMTRCTHFSGCGSSVWGTVGDRCTVEGVKQSDRSPGQCAGTRGAQAKDICQEKTALPATGRLEMA